MSIRLVSTRRSPSAQLTIYARGKPRYLGKPKVTEKFLAGTRKENVSALLSFIEAHCCFIVIGINAHRDV